MDRAGDTPVDLGVESEVTAAAEAVIAKLGGCDVLVHAVGAFDPMSIDSVNLATWRHVQAVNVESLMLLAAAFVPGMRERGFGRIIIVGSNTFWNPPSGEMLAYVTSKGALLGFARTLARGLGGDNIAVTTVAPGLTRTPGSADVPAEFFAEVESRQVVKRPLVTDDVSAAVSFFAREESGATSGQTLITDGGFVFD